MPTPPLGRLEQVHLRSIWPDEAGDFTPWLALPENLKLLGDSLGIELEYIRRDFDFRVREQWEEAFVWLARYLQVFTDVFGPAVKGL